jgi:Flp pilus assembly protein TadG
MRMASFERLRPHAGPARRTRTRVAHPRRRREGGQSLVEFSLILAPLLFILLGIIQFGFIFNSVVTLSTAAREAARDGSVYVYDRNLSKQANDTARNNKAKTTLLVSMNGLVKTSPQFSAGTTWTNSTSGTTSTYTNGDIVITYELPTGLSDSDMRSGYRMSVRTTYHQDLLMPLISNLLPKDANGRLTLGGEVTMVIN